MSMLKSFIGVIRIPFLIATPACVILGLGTAVWTSGHVSAINFIIALFGAVLAHISVNALNEYSDFKSGLDSRTERTPFSGGTGTLQADPLFAPWALKIGLISLGLIVLAGIYFWWIWSWAIVPLGIAGLFVIVTYTPLIVHYPFLCLAWPGLGFGVLMVMGTNFALTGGYTVTSFIASLVPFFLVGNLLLLNQFPDVEADKTVGRKHLPIVIGKRKSSIVYAGFLLGAYVSIVAGVYLGYFPKLCLIGLATMLLALPAAIGAYRYAEDTKKLTPYLTLNVIITTVTPVLVAVPMLIK